MDELIALQEQARNLQAQMESEPTTNVFRHLLDIWRAIDMLAAHIMMLREGSDAGK